MLSDTVCNETKKWRVYKFVSKKADMQDEMQIKSIHAKRVFSGKQLRFSLTSISKLPTEDRIAAQPHLFRSSDFNAYY